MTLGKYNSSRSGAKISRPSRPDHGAAVLLVSEDLDELLELSDRIVVMFEGQVVHETTPADADLTVIGRFMAGH